jgi:hypothetical protein
VPSTNDAPPASTERSAVRRCALASALTIGALLAGCAAPPAPPALAAPELAAWSSVPQRFPPPEERDPRLGPRWQAGEVRPTGYLGITQYEDITLTRGGEGPNLAQDDDLQTPTIGGGFLFKLGGEAIDLGVEAMLSISGRGSVSAFVSGSGGTAVLVDIDLLICDLYGGPFASVWIADKWRLYGSAGPLVQFAGYDQQGVDESFDEDGSGFGTGWYGRAGLEYFTSWGTSVGIGVRYIDSNIELDDFIGEIDAVGMEYAITVTTEW